MGTCCWRVWSRMVWAAHPVLYWTYIRAVISPVSVRISSKQSSESTPIVSCHQLREFISCDEKRKYDYAKEVSNFAPINYHHPWHVCRISVSNWMKCLRMSKKNERKKKKYSAILFSETHHYRWVLTDNLASKVFNKLALNFFVNLFFLNWKWV